MAAGQPGSDMGGSCMHDWELENHVKLQGPDATIKITIEQHASAVHTGCSLSVQKVSKPTTQIADLGFIYKFFWATGSTYSFTVYA